MIKLKSRQEERTTDERKKHAGSQNRIRVVQPSAFVSGYQPTSCGCQGSDFLEWTIDDGQYGSEEQQQTKGFGDSTECGWMQRYLVSESQIQGTIAVKEVPE